MNKYFKKLLKTASLSKHYWVQEFFKLEHTDSNFRASIEKDTMYSNIWQNIWFAGQWAYSPSAPEQLLRTVKGKKCWALKTPRVTISSLISKAVTSGVSQRCTSDQKPKLRISINWGLTATPPDTQCTSSGPSFSLKNPNFYSGVVSDTESGPFCVERAPPCGFMSYHHTWCAQVTISTTGLSEGSTQCHRLIIKNYSVVRMILLQCSGVTKFLLYRQDRREFLFIFNFFFHFQRTPLNLSFPTGR